MEKSILEKIFNSPRKFKELSLLLRTKEAISLEEIKKYLSYPLAAIKKDLDDLVKLDVLKRVARPQKIVYFANQDFALFVELQNLFEKELLFSQKDLSKTLEKLGKINLLVFSGELVKDSFAQVDAVVVGDSVKEKEFAKIISSLEKSLGRELRYSIFSNKEFTYRFQMHDAFVRDILNRPKKILINNNDFLSQFSEEKNIPPKEEPLGN